jgi:anti-anti-sigma factor
MSELPPFPPRSCIDTRSAGLRFESGQESPTTSQARIGRAGDADAFALDWELPGQPVERSRRSSWSRAVGDAWRGTGNACGDRPEAQGGELAIAIGRSLGTVVVRLAGPMEGLAVARLATALDDLIDGQGNLAIAVDLRGVRCLAPAALEVLSAAGSALERRGGRLMLCEARGGTLGALELAGLRRFIRPRLVDVERRAASVAPAPALSHPPTRRAAASHPAGSGRQANRPGRHA